MSSAAPPPPTFGGEHGQTILIERQNSMHRQPGGGVLTSPSQESLPLLKENFAYGSLGGDDRYTIRHQVVVWYIGKLDVVTSSVPMTFRVTLFWNDPGIAGMNHQQQQLDGGAGSTSATAADDVSISTTTTSTTATARKVWKMHGRRQAYPQDDIPLQSTIDVPPISIMNVSTFEIVSSPEITMLNDDTRLMRWTCMYRATVIQENLTVERFPHDIHDIQLRLAILSERNKGRRWDRRIWKLGLATAADNMHSIRVPHGLVVDTVRMPDFHYNKERNLQFQFCRLKHGLVEDESNDMYLQASLTVLRESGYYDNNIVPLLALLNVVAVSVTTMDDTDFFQRGLLTMNIAFVEIGIRMTADSHLPSVGYEIHLQKILNEFFFMLMFLVLEAMSVSVLRQYFGATAEHTKIMDWMTGIIAVSHNFYTVYNYYSAKSLGAKELKFGYTDPKQAKSL